MQTGVLVRPELTRSGLSWASRTGCVTVIQRCGGALNANAHFHSAGSWSVV